MGNRISSQKKSRVSPLSQHIQQQEHSSEADCKGRTEPDIPAPRVSEDCVFLSPDSTLDGLSQDDRNIMLAAAYVEDAKLERGGYGKFQYHFKPRHAQIAFRILTSHPFQILIYFNVILHASLTFFEPPSVSMYLKDSIAAIILNFVCLVLYTVDVFLIVLFLSFKTFLKSSDCIRAKVELILLCLFAMDWLLLVIQVAVFETTGNQAVGYIVQPFRCLRLAMIVCKSRNVAHVLAVMLSITVKLGKLMFVMLVYILIFSSIGTHLLMPHYSASNGSRLLEQLTANVCISAYSNVSADTREAPLFPKDTYSSRHLDGFHNIGIASVNLFVLFTTENYPGFIFPSYANSPASWLFFGIFISIGVFLLAPLLLAVIADLYWEYNKKHVKKERTKQRKLLIEAWNLLDSGNKEYLPVDSPNLCKLFRILKPKNSEEENKELLNYLDPDESGYIHWVEWVTELLFVLDLEKSKQPKEDGEKVSSSCSTAVSDFCERLTTWKHFNRAVLVFIIIYCLLFVLTWEGIEPVVELVIQLLRTAIVVLFCVEILLRIVGAGRGIVRKKQEIIEMCLVVLGFCSNVVWYGWYALDSRAEGYVLRAYYWKGSCTFLSSLFIFTRLLFNSAQTKRALQLLLHLFPVIWDLLILFMIVVYTYAVVGMESFRHIPIQQPVDHCYEHYEYGCGVGFVDFKCSLLMVFQIITTNNWHDIMYGVIQNAQTYAPVVYFIPCFIIINLLLMNLLISIGLEAVNYFTKRTDQLELDSEEKEDNNEEAAVRKGSGNLGAKQHVRFQLKDQVWECLKTLKVYFGAAFRSARSDPEEMDLSFSPQHSTHPSRIQSGKLLSRTNTRRGRRNVEMELALLRLPIPECTTPDPSLDDIEVCSDTDLSDISEQSAQEAGRYTDAASQRRVRASSESDNSEIYQQGVTNGGKSRRRLFSTAHAIRSLNRTRKISTDSSGSSKRKNSIEESDKERSQLMKGRFHVRKKVNWRTEIQDMTLINSSEFQELRERLREASVEVKQSNVGELGVTQNSENLMRVEIQPPVYEPSVSRIEETSESDVNLVQSSNFYQSVRAWTTPENSEPLEPQEPVVSVYKCEDSVAAIPNSFSGSQLHTPQSVLSDSLKVPTPILDSMEQQARNPQRSNPKPPNGEIPDWVKSFTQSNNLNISPNVLNSEDDDARDERCELDCDRSNSSSVVDMFELMSENS